MAPRLPVRDRVLARGHPNVRGELVSAFPAPEGRHWPRHLESAWCHH